MVVAGHSLSLLTGVRRKLLLRLLLIIVRRGLLLLLNFACCSKQKTCGVAVWSAIAMSYECWRTARLAGVKLVVGCGLCCRASIAQNMHNIQAILDHIAAARALVQEQRKRLTEY